MNACFGRQLRKLQSRVAESLNSVGGCLHASRGLGSALMRRRSTAGASPEADITAWSSFLPACALRQLHEVAFDGEAASQLEGHQGLATAFESAALFADASGFTALTEKLAQLPDGAEVMCNAMNKFLTAVIETVHGHGGDVVKFAGDAVSVIFPVSSSGGSMRAAAVRATACALALHARVHGFVAWLDPASQQQFTLSLHIGVGIGRLTVLHLGGLQSQSHDAQIPVRAFSAQRHHADATASCALQAGCTRAASSSSRARRCASRPLQSRRPRPERRASRPRRGRLSPMWPTAPSCRRPSRRRASSTSRRPPRLCW